METRAARDAAEYGWLSSIVTRTCVTGGCCLCYPIHCSGA